MLRNIYPSLVTILSAILFILPSSSQAQWLNDEKAIMGTAVRVELWHENPKTGKELIQLVMDEMRRIDLLMSTYKKDSELSRVNQSAYKSPVPVSKELFGLLNKAHYFSELTKGAFDITYASIGRYYNYRKGVKPSEKVIKENLPAINYNHVVLEPNNQTVTFLSPHVYIDLGGIAKGHAVDNSIALLKAHNIKHAVVTAGGDSRILGDKRGKPWMMGIRHPRLKNSVAALIPVTDAAISTSGDYERYFLADGELHHHILNPSTGRSASKSQSTTIIATDATTTDALSTSIFVLGPEKGLQLIESLKGIEVVIIAKDGKMTFSSGLANLVPDKPADVSKE